VGVLLVRHYDLGGLPQQQRAEETEQAVQAAMERIAQENATTVDEVQARIVENSNREAALAAPGQTVAALQMLAHEATSRKATPVALTAYVLIRAIERHDCNAVTVTVAELDAKVAAVEEGSAREALVQRAARVHRGLGLICAGDI
jgi:hypothetical protein